MGRKVKEGKLEYADPEVIRTKVVIHRYTTFIGIGDLITMSQNHNHSGSPRITSCVVQLLEESDSGKGDTIRKSTRRPLHAVLQGWVVGKKSIFLPATLRREKSTTPLPRLRGYADDRFNSRKLFGDSLP